MKFLYKNAKTQHMTSPWPTNNSAIENYIHNTKTSLDNYLPEIFTETQHNLTKSERKSLQTLRKKHHRITIKPADKNLGIVILNAEDYIDQCMQHLTTANTYQLKNKFPETLHQLITNTLINFKEPLLALNRNLYYYLHPPNKHRTPRFYGIPKIHKPLSEKGIPLIRPIISHVNSLLSHTAQFIDHVLQPLAQSYPDYLHNSTSLIQTLEEFKIPSNTTLISMDVVSLYPSIPQTECLNVIYTEMQTHTELHVHV